jgi:hypothetical protein
MQSIRNLWENLKEVEFDLIIDDGLHTFDANSTLLENSYDKLVMNGFYVIEDIMFDNIAKYDQFSQPLPCQDF